jgi:heme-degrading monooxygenase HmoA
MFCLHIDLNLKTGEAQALEHTFIESFRPAISSQPGFHRVELLRPNESQWDYRLVIVFDSQPQQQAWVASDLHQQVWPQIESHILNFALRHYTRV